MKKNFKYHHLGKVVKSITQQYTFYQKLGYKILPGFEQKKPDRRQSVLVGVVKKGSILIELLEPLGKKSPVFNFSKTTQGFHHICYQTNNLKRSKQQFEKKFGFRQITPVTISVWDGRPVVFFIDKSMEVIELIGAINEKKRRD